MPTAEQRFFAKVQQSDDCWVWTGTGKGLGYGQFWYGTGMVPSYRWCWEFFNGPIPDGLVCDHMCHNHSCVNPWHIQLVTRQLNMENRQGARKGSSSGVRGVSWNRKDQRWQVGARLHGKNHYGGSFIDLADAEAAAIELRNQVFTNNLVDRGENITTAAAELIAS